MEEKIENELVSRSLHYLYSVALNNCEIPIKGKEVAYESIIEYIVILQQQVKELQDKLNKELEIKNKIKEYCKINTDDKLDIFSSEQLNKILSIIENGDK